MESGSSYLTSRFGKRTFALLIVLIIVPVAVAAFAAFLNLEYELRQQAEKRLHHSAKEFGLSVLQRLILIKRDAGFAFGDGAEYDPPFQLVAEGDGGSIRSRLPVHPQASGDALRSRALLFTDGVAAGEPRLFMVVEGRSSPITLEIDTEHLWGPEDHLPLTHLCVTASDGTVMHCSTSTARILLASSETNRPARTIYRIDPDGQAYLGYGWQLFLKSDFSAPDWSVHAFQSEAEALAPARSFQKLFVPAMIALIAGTLLLGAIQIRRRLKPLGQLVTGTRQVANHDFSTRIEVQSGDEFEDLASSFNAMTRRLGAQISTMKTLSRIDKTILETLDIEAVSSHVVNGLKDLAPATCIAVAFVDPDAPDQGQIYYSQPGAEVLDRKRIRMEGGHVRWHQHQDGIMLPACRGDLPFLDPIRDSGAESCFAVPFFSDEQLDGVLCLGFEDEGDFAYEYREVVQDFADRLAVATAADKKEKLLQKQANFDQLTGLPNRFLFKDRLDQAVIHARDAKRQIAVLFLDLDRFKHVNDTLGHSHGDKLLKHAAARLLSCVGEGDTLARLGGDEFVALVPDAEPVDRIIGVATRILEAFTQPFPSRERELLVGVSIGIALFPQDGADAESLLRNADTAMYAAKDQGRGTYVLFDRGMNSRLQERARMEADLWRAIRDEEFELWYQPQIDLQNNRVCGAEALIRWRHPELGIVIPDQFVPLAEEIGLIEDIGSRALEMACRQYDEWRRMGFEPERIAVNVSPREITSDYYVPRVTGILRKYAIPPLRLTLEITENLLIHDTEKVMDRLARLKEAGVSFTVDDFGIGYSSLSYLQKLPIDTLKIDGSFIRDVTTNRESAAIVAAILDMAGRLDIKVIAEGVETQAQVAYLRDAGCRQIQGYVCAVPLPPDQFLTYSKSTAA